MPTTRQDILEKNMLLSLEKIVHFLYIIIGLIPFFSGYPAKRAKSQQPYRVVQVSKDKEFFHYIAWIGYISSYPGFY